MVVSSALLPAANPPARFTMPASEGDATLVPPNTSHPLDPWHLVLSYTETPVFGSESKEKSGTPRALPTMLAIPAWYGGRASYLLGPPPLPLHPVSLTKLPKRLRLIEVPPADTTFGETPG